MKVKFYQAPKSNPKNLIMAIVTLSIISIFLGWIYIVLAYIPIVYIGFLITVGFGMAIAYSTQFVSKFLKIVDRKSKLILVIVAIIVAYYSHWISFIIQTYNGEFPKFLDYIYYWIFPSNIFKFISEISSYGTWGFGMSNPINVKGVILILVWIVEAFIIFFLPIRYIFNFPESPFSEKFNKWYPKITIDEQFQNFYSSKRFISLLEEKGVDFLLNLDAGLPIKYSKISIFYIEGEDKQYLTVENVSITTQEESKKKVIQVLKPFEISMQEAKRLFEKYKTKKEFYLDY